MTPLQARKAAFEYERTHQGASLSMAFMQGYLFKEREQPHVQGDTSPCSTTLCVDDSSSSFSQAWLLYDRKDNKQSALKAWNKLTPSERTQALNHIPMFVRAHPEKKYRPMLATYLNQKRFLDEEIISQNNEQSDNPQQQRFAAYAAAISNVGRQG